MTFTASDVLLKAASRIEEEGMWCQGSWFDTDDITPKEYITGGWAGANGVRELALVVSRQGKQLPACAEGALAVSQVELMGRFDEKFHSAILNQFWDVIGSHPISFNDTPGRTAFEVAEAMRKAALL